MRENYSDVEVDAFMKLLSIRPHNQWQDESTSHQACGVHRYEDGPQQLDPNFHILSESEREHADRIATNKWRQGTEVRFQVGDKKVPVFPNMRFWRKKISLTITENYKYISYVMLHALYI